MDPANPAILPRLGSVMTFGCLSAYFFALISAPELITSSLINMLSVALEKNLEQRGLVSDQGFCQNVDKVTTSFGHLSKVMLLILGSLNTGNSHK